MCYVIENFNPHSAALRLTFKAKADFLISNLKWLIRYQNLYQGAQNLSQALMLEDVNTKLLTGRFFSLDHLNRTVVQEERSLFAVKNNFVKSLWYYTLLNAFSTLNHLETPLRGYQSLIYSQRGKFFRLPSKLGEFAKVFYWYQRILVTNWSLPNRFVTFSPTVLPLLKDELLLRYLNTHFFKIYN